jgi:hypothetical protein
MIEEYPCKQSGLLTRINFRRGNGVSGLARLLLLFRRTRRLGRGVAREREGLFELAAQLFQPSVVNQVQPFTALGSEVHYRWLVGLISHGLNPGDFV